MHKVSQAPALLSTAKLLVKDATDRGALPRRDRGEPEPLRDLSPLFPAIRACSRLPAQTDH